MRKKHIETSVFIEVWEDSRTLREVCTKLGMIPTSASSRATILRSRNIRLKIMPRFDITTDEELLAMALSYKATRAAGEIPKKDKSGE